jgi:hypothetical protein|tara:strand:- start:117 stop:431 length:315 start_codon:yes stop_codon:yes gene_type:complete
MLLMILMGVIIPIIFGLIHTIIGVYLIYSKGNITALGWNMLGFVTKSIFMLFMTYVGIVVLGLNWRIYISILTFTWFITHILEALYITKHMNENCSDLIKRMQI